MSKNMPSMEEIQTLATTSMEDEVVSTEPVPETADIPLEITGETSDGNHTFNELYYCRMVLFAVITGFARVSSWKSKKHEDGSMHDGYFIVGVTTPKGNFTFHYELEHWDMFDVEEVESAPEWDGHETKDILRLLSLIPQPVSEPTSEATPEPEVTEPSNDE